MALINDLPNFQFLIEIINRRSLIESRLVTGNAQVDFFNVFGTKLSTVSAALISFNVTVSVPNTSQLFGTGIRYFRIIGRANVGLALAEFSVLTFEGRPLRITSVTKSSMAVSGGQSWNCVDGDLGTDCLTASGATESILFDMGALILPAAIQKIIVVNRVGVGARDTLAGQPLQFLSGSMVILSSYTFPTDTRDQYQFPEACDFGTFLRFSDCANCPVMTYKDQVGDASSCTACPVRNGIQTVTIGVGSKSLSSRLPRRICSHSSWHLYGLRGQHIQGCIKCLELLHCVPARLKHRKQNCSSNMQFLCSWVFRLFGGNQL